MSWTPTYGEGTPSPPEPEGRDVFPTFPPEVGDADAVDIRSAAGTPSLPDGPRHPRPINLTRNLYHALNSVSVVLLVEYVLTTDALRIGVSSAGLAAAWSMEAARRLDPRINRLLMGLFSRVAHPHEANHVNSATWYTTAIFVMALGLPLYAGVAGLMVLGFGDPAAAAVGQRFGRRKLLGGRTLEGSLAFVVVGFLPAFAALSLWHLPPTTAAPLALAASVGGATGELVAGPIDDNLMIPLASATAVVALAALVGAG